MLIYSPPLLHLSKLSLILQVSKLINLKRENMLLHQKIFQGKYKREAISNVPELYEYPRGTQSMFHLSIMFYSTHKECVKAAF